MENKRKEDGMSRNETVKDEIKMIINQRREEESKWDAEIASTEAFLKEMEIDFEANYSTNVGLITWDGKGNIYWLSNGPALPFQDLSEPAKKYCHSSIEGLLREILAQLKIRSVD